MVSTELTLIDNGLHAQFVLLHATSFVQITGNNTSSRPEKGRPTQQSTTQFHIHQQFHNPRVSSTFLARFFFFGQSAREKT